MAALAAVSVATKATSTTGPNPCGNASNFTAVRSAW
jgi:hypothetical protein